MISGGDSEIGVLVASLTARLVAHHDAMSIIDAVSQACATALDAAASGVVIADPRDGFTVLHASDDTARLVELVQANAEQGPCVDAITTAAEVAVGDLSTDGSQWPPFTALAQSLGYHALYAFPLRLDHTAVGALNLLYTRPVRLSESDRHVGQALADVIVLGLTQEQDQRRLERLAERSLTTLNDRAHLTQAVGLVTATLAIEPDAARELMSEYARRTDRSLRQVCQALTDLTLDPHQLGEAAAPRH